MKNILTILFISHSSSFIADAQWTQTAAPPADPVYALLAYGDTIFAGIGSGCIRTTNNGNNWSSSLSTSFRSFTAASGYIFGGTQNAGVYVSSNSGTNWLQMNSGLTASYIRSMTSSPPYVFAGSTTAGVFVTTNYGSNWTQASSGLSNNYIFSMLVHGTNVNAGTGPSNGGVYKSANYGANWAYSGLVNDFIYALVARGPVVFAGGDITGAYRSSDNGITWTQINNGLPNFFINSMLAYNSYVLAGTQGGLYVTSNDGGNWSYFGQGLPNNWIYGLAYNSTYMFAGLYNSNGIWRRPLSDLTGIRILNSSIPEKFVSHQNYPNPFNAKTKIRFEIPGTLLSFGEGLGVRLFIYNVLGYEAASLVNEELKPGTYEVEWNASDFPSGTYYYRLSAGDFSQTRKMILLK